MAVNHYAGIIEKYQNWYTVQRLNSVPCHLSENETAPPLRHPAHIAALEAILAVTIPRVAVIFKCIMYKVTYGATFNI